MEAFRASDTWIHGAFALEQGFIFSAMILAAVTTNVIERRFRTAGSWSLAGAVLCVAGLMHSYRWTPGDTAVSLSPAWAWAGGYLIMAAFLMLAPLVTVEETEPT